MLNDNKSLSDGDERNSAIDNNILDDDILKEYQTEKFNNSINTIDDYFWRYNHTNSKNNDDYNINDTEYKEKNDDGNNNYFNYSNELVVKKNVIENEIDVSEKIKNVIKIINEIDSLDNNKINEDKVDKIEDIDNINDLTNKDLLLKKEGDKELGILIKDID